jgi:hypothetical protein
MNDQGPHPYKRQAELQFCTERLKILNWQRDVCKKFGVTCLFVHRFTSYVVLSGIGTDQLLHFTATYVCNILIPSVETPHSLYRMGERSTNKPPKPGAGSAKSIRSLTSGTALGGRCVSIPQPPMTAHGPARGRLIWPFGRPSLPGRVRRIPVGGRGFHHNTLFQIIWLTKEIRKNSSVYGIYLQCYENAVSQSGL